MCFALHLGTRTVPSAVPHPDGPPQFWVNLAPRNDEVVRWHFTLPVLSYLGSDTGCSCGYRNITFQNGGWGAEWFYQNDPDWIGGNQNNHDALAAYLRRLLEMEPFVELYGCWEGEWAEPELHRGEATPDLMADPKFVFRSRGFYLVQPDASLR